MKRIMGVFIIGTVVLNGCSYSAKNMGSPIANTNTIMNQDIQLISFQPENKKRFEDLMNGEKETVFWNHKEIRNLKRLDKFLYNVSHNIKDQVRVETSAKDQVVEIDHEGNFVETEDFAQIVTELSYDGERLLVKTNGETKEYEKIFVEERFSEHYNGTFVNYIVEDKEGKQMLALQIMPNLAES